MPPELASVALLHLIVMDHDFLVSNDFAGEAFLDLHDVPGIRGTTAPMRTSVCGVLAILWTPPSASQQRLKLQAPSSIASAPGVELGELLGHLVAA